MTSTTSCCCCGCCAKNAWVLPKDMPPAVVEHMSKGKFVELQDHTKIFVRDEGSNNTNNKPTIVMIHGVPASSFLYQKLFDPLVEQGYRVVAMDLPGLGLSDKPTVVDQDYYSWPVLAETLGEILEHSDLQLFSSSSSYQERKIHLVIHDIGGPIAALWMAAASHHHNIDKVLSMTVLDTPLDLETFRKPFPMNMFPIPIVGSILPWPP